MSDKLPEFPDRDDSARFPFIAEMREYQRRGGIGKGATEGTDLDEDEIAYNFALARAWEARCRVAVEHIASQITCVHGQACETCQSHKRVLALIGPLPERK